jgi:hypothetical protein
VPILFLLLIEICDSGHEKNPLAWSPAGSCVSLDLSGRLLQAMAVRRHLGPVMVVMTVMAVALHLFQS